MLKTLGRSTAALLCVLTLASCNLGDADEKAADLCGTTSSSEEAVLLREVLETEGFTTKVRKSMGELVKKLERDLRSMRPEKQTYYHLTCTFQADTDTRLAQANFSFAWAPRTSPQQPWFTGDVSYDVNGARGVADYTKARLLVQCDMPGELAEQSQKAYLSADVYYSFMDFEPDTGQAATDRKMALAALMTRRVTEALGCENKPLEKPPVVKPLPTP
ncbi:hypothetical protein HYE82_27050 [Streptomyces sp. BR123]|uniref:hypothetical protein n=1 Tax=Streptomyces sp. BR123 TaxID=2749828 RepID=UPI0015C45BCA|nr:hypothetical protein [Streptomyces sp. BR123]NXY97968.1 hypothetical protein [Streptomyces sp. BR123]